MVCPFRILGNGEKLVEYIGHPFTEGTDTLGGNNDVRRRAMGCPTGHPRAGNVDVPKLMSGVRLDPRLRTVQRTYTGDHTAT